jgi:putative transposase
MMKASKFSDAQKAFILKQGNEGVPVARRSAARPGSARRPISIGRRSVTGCCQPMRKLKQLEDENTKLKKLMADLSLVAAWSSREAQEIARFRPETFMLVQNALPVANLMKFYLETLVQVANQLGHLTQPLAGGSDVLRVFAVFVVAVPFSRRSTTAVCASVHPTPSPACDRRRLARRS